MKTLHSWRLTLLLLCTLLASLTHAASIEDVRIWPEPTKIRVVFDLSEPVTFETFTLDNPNRVVIDVPAATFAADLDSIDWPEPIEQLRYAAHNQDTLRLVLDMQNAVSPDVFTLEENEQYGHRLVVDLLDPQIANADDPIAAIAAAHTQDRSPRIPAQPERSEFIVAIDAGHGGEDPGSIGPRGTYEKDIVLAISRKFAATVNAEPGMRAVMIRDGDYYVGLRQRINIAREHQADIFISIHADAFKEERANGASVFTLSQSGASSEAARWLAAHENRSDLVGGVSLNDKDDMLASVLLDLSQTASTQSSLQMGNAVLAQLGGMTRLHSETVQHAGFAVLKSPDIPSILVETGFISNRNDEGNLRRDAYQQQLADAILIGVKNYMRATNQYNDLPQLHMAGQEYTIQRGDTLSTIAGRYGVSVTSLRQSNNLSSDQLRIGQVLQIPVT